MSELTVLQARSAAATGDDPGALREFPPLGTAIKVLMVWPKFPPSFWGMEGMTSIVTEKSSMPPLGLITVAALCPKSWTVRLIDRAFDKLRDSDILWADLVMVSGMHVQKGDMAEILRRAQKLGKRTMVGGPYASSEPHTLLALADHVVVGEPDESFGTIAAELESGRARRLYVVHDKPDVSRSPTPRFDLLKLDNYINVTVQFSRGCPFQCEFCDIITLYGRKPRTKQPAQLLAEMQALLDLGWRKRVFVVDDNFIGNHRLALELVQELAVWQKAHDYPFLLFTEASLDLAQRPELIDGMVKANFFFVFTGIETTSKESLAEAKKFQNLRKDPLESIRIIQSRGLWICAGFIIGFDSDTEDVFEQQKAFIETAAIPWAMAGLLQAPPTTPLYARMQKAGRLLDESPTTNFMAPNFKTILPLPVLLRGYRDILKSIYAPEAFYERAYRSLLIWESTTDQRGTHYPRFRRKENQPPPMAGTVLRSIVQQGIFSSYRRAYWRFFLRIISKWSRNPPKMNIGFAVLFSGHHFIRYAKNVAAQLELELGKLGPDAAPTGAVAPAGD